MRHSSMRYVDIGIPANNKGNLVLDAIGCFWLLARMVSSKWSVMFSSAVLMDGYHLKQVGPYSFSCQKLSPISAVSILPKDVTNEPFPSALLSLSGDDGLSEQLGDWHWWNFFI